MKSINLASVDLNLLVAFEMLFEERSVSGAARRLHLGQPALSAALARLRILFCDPLFVRVGKEMRPTPRALGIAPGILAALEQIRQTVLIESPFDPALECRSFTISSSDYTSFVVLPALIEHCSQVAPGIDFRLIAFEKDKISALLDEGEIDLALGVFQESPQHAHCTPLFKEHFMGIARRGNPALSGESMTIEAFAALPHVLMTTRRDTMGQIDQVLSRHNFKRRVAVSMPHMLVLPFAVAQSEMIATVPSRLARLLAEVANLEIFELPIETEPWHVSMAWSVLQDQDDANCWLRETLTYVCQKI
jgi:DNA-binding transcriptional LysR family regulator